MLLIQPTSLGNMHGSGDLYIQLEKEINCLAVEQLNARSAADEIERWGKYIGNDVSMYGNPELAGAAFHEMLLRIHKAMHVSAMDYCRTKLKDMMAEIYQFDRVLMHLHRDQDIK